MNLGYRIWVEGSNGTFLGRGRISLLEKIHEMGSISKASKSLGMSYKKAWNLVDSMNKEAGEDLVECTSGGKRGGGTSLTARGKAAIQQFQQLESKVDDFVKQEFNSIQF